MNDEEPTGNTLVTSSNSIQYGSICCEDTPRGGGDLTPFTCGSNTMFAKSRPFCSNMAEVDPMQYLFCDFMPQVCLGGDGSPFLRAKFNAKLSAGTTPFDFYSGSHCYWRVLPPNDFTDFVQVKIRINKLLNADCHIINGGTIMSAKNSTECVEGKTYEFDYYG